ncbi:response regulator [Albimonas pacifica]|uniref:Response regulator receiver domain-containing protein n=1 Tax=Albimonas pacifica TaxID=1114924 RepID=A0A1I3JMK8_9RHOB|nr:response regulator [Albimonas pacifica]SFI61404.1 Response regulator receiver domain-containing protein [Albimonas pacifica]
MPTTGRELTRIACVEDEPDLRRICELTLSRLGGFEVQVYADGPSALAGLAAFAPDLVLLDVMMPGLDGPAVLAELRARPSLAALPVAFMTAKAQPAEIARFRALGACDVIVKPFDPMTLSERVRRIWAELEEP